MKRIETILRRGELGQFSQCVEALGILGFDLAEDRNATFKVDFAVLDKEAKDTIHAVLEKVHPDSIAIFKLENESPLDAVRPNQADGSRAHLDHLGVWKGK
jgi:hypothetical protein